MSGLRRRSDESPPLLPIVRRRRRRLAHSFSCWYCDFKITAFNDFLFNLGRRHARLFRVWYSIGVGFSFTSIVATVCMLLWDLVGQRVYPGRSMLWNLSTGAVLGLSPLVSGWSFSILDAAYLTVSTMISVLLHEFGHAFAAASEGVRVEYIAIFLAVLFPGALVALSHELLQNVTRFAELRIYCAGIWHNAMVCLLCGLGLLLLPLILSPFYIYSDNPLVIDVKAESPLYGYLSSRDTVLGINDFIVRSPHEWKTTMGEFDRQVRYRGGSWNTTLSSNKNIYGVKGYCIPHSWIDGGVIHPLDGRLICSDGLAAFRNPHCSNLSISMPGDTNNIGTECISCFAAKDIITLRNCVQGSMSGQGNESSSLCSQEESCMVPVQLPGVAWVEITYLSAECLESRQNYSIGMMADAMDSNFCRGMFVFVGDLSFMSQSVHLTSFWPRWEFKLAFFYPNVLENILSYTFSVSLTLALLNSMPVFFLDGQQILEAGLFYITWLTPSWRRKILRTLLIMGSVLSSLVLVRVIFSYPA